MQDKLDFDSLKSMAESISGSFSFNILDSNNNIYIVKGDSPVSILHFKNAGVYVFASTEHILWRALIESELFAELQCGNFDEIPLNEGEILKIRNNGELEKSEFTYTDFVGRHWYEYDSMQISVYDDEYMKAVKSIAAMYGIEPEIIEELYNEGFTFDELEEMIYCGGDI